MATAMLSAFAAQSAAPSGTVPTIYINTENNVPVTSKDVYLDATYYLEDNGFEGVESLGSEAKPLPLTIKGRGNYTWTGFDKKPYKLKFDKKTAIIGMGKNKHFALLAHADDDLAFMRNVAGLELSRRMNLAFTPADAPVEVVLNGEYLGLYFFTETIRVDGNRVDITEQDDNAEDNVDGGWLVEIDNYSDDPHVSIVEGNGQRIIFTYKSPEALSPEQEGYLRSQMTALNTAIYAADKNASENLESLLDMESAARFYVVQELMDDCESYHGSCYLYKDRGEGEKWKFGPVWDFGNAFRRGDKNRFIWQDPQFNQTWIGELYKFPAFQEKVKEVWKEFCDNGYDGLSDYIREYADDIKEAATSNFEKWPQYGNGDICAGSESMLAYLKGSVKWLGKQWGYLPQTGEPIEQVYIRGTFNSWSTSTPMSWINGKWEYPSIDFSGEFKIASADWSAVDLGAGSFGDSPVAEVKYVLAPKGQNINMAASNYGKRMIVDQSDNTLLITDKTEIDFIVSDDDVLDTEIYTIEGQRVSSMDTKGIYILRRGSETIKVMK